MDSRRRSAAPVSHQMRPFCQLRPASCRVRDGEPADLRQAVRGLAQGCLQQAHRPGDRVILLSLGRARPLGQNGLLLRSSKADPRRAGMMRVHGGQPFPVEAADPGRDHLCVAASDQTDGGSLSSPLAIAAGRGHGRARWREHCASGSNARVLCAPPE
jgi:hypothetical protein